MKISNYLLLLFFTLTLSAAQAQNTVFTSHGKVKFPTTSGDEKMLDSIQHKTFLFFLHEYHPEKGIVKDRTTKQFTLQYSCNRVWYSLICNRSRKKLDKPRTSG